MSRSQPVQDKWNSSSFKSYNLLINASLRGLLANNASGENHSLKQIQLYSSIWFTFAHNISNNLYNWHYPLIYTILLIKAHVMYNYLIWSLPFLRTILCQLICTKAQSPNCHFYTFFQGLYKYSWGAFFSTGCLHMAADLELFAGTLLQFFYFILTLTY